MTYLIIDANIYLSFYRLNTDDLEELRKLSAIIGTGELKLYTNKQIRDEVMRNRAKVLAESLKAAKDVRLPTAFPQVVRNYPEFDELTKLRREFSDCHNKLMELVTADAKSKSLQADTLLEDLFEASEDLPISANTVELAMDRVNRGNPPGKNGSNGDAITWQTLLDSHPRDVPLHLITQDSDYISPLATDSLHEYLEIEWEREKNSSLPIYPNMSSFFAIHYPSIRLSADAESEIAIGRLISSPSYIATHAAIALLSTLPDLSDDQAKVVFEGSLANTQIRWILSDYDVKNFFRTLLDNHSSVLSDATIAEFEGLLNTSSVNL